MKYSKEKILEALHVVKETCDEFEPCSDDCPFNRVGDCLITIDNPSNWRINDMGLWKGLL